MTVFQQAVQVSKSSKKPKTKPKIKNPNPGGPAPRSDGSHSMSAETRAIAASASKRASPQLLPEITMKAPSISISPNAGMSLEFYLTRTNVSCKPVQSKNQKERTLSPWQEYKKLPISLHLHEDTTVLRWKRPLGFTEEKLPMN